MNAAAIVLCGGRSSRMGRPKALLPWRGRPMVAHLVATLRSCVDEVVVVSAADLELPNLDARVVVDEEPGLGPLAGLMAGLAAIESSCAFATATDTPWLDPALVEVLLAEGPTVAVASGGHIEPLAAVYPRSAADTAKTLLAAGQRRPLALLEAFDYRSVDASELPGGDSLRSLNTPAQYLEAVRESEPDASAQVEFLGRCRVKTGARERRVAVGTLAEVLGRAAPDLAVCEAVGDTARVANHFLVSLGAERFVRDATLPVGAGERLFVMDASAGG